jgi:hypothetical protein
VAFNEYHLVPLYTLKWNNPYDFLGLPLVNLIHHLVQNSPQFDTSFGAKCTANFHIISMHVSSTKELLNALPVCYKLCGLMTCSTKNNNGYVQVDVTFVWFLYYILLNLWPALYLQSKNVFIVLFAF